MLDFILAIAKYPQHNGPTPEDLLREQYPQLSFFFDEVAGLREELDALNTEGDAAVHEAEVDLEGAVDVMAVCRDLIDTIRRMDAAGDVEDLLADVSNKLDIEVHLHD